MVTDSAVAATIPRHHEMMWPIVQALKQLGHSGTIQEIDDRAIRIAGFTEAQQSVIHGKGPGTEISYRLAWARTYLRFGGAIENSSRGVWTITEVLD